MEKIYMQYAETFSSISSLEFQLSEKRRALEEIREELMSDKDGGFGIELSAHAFTNIANRLSDLASENPIIHKAVMNIERPERCLLWPSNMKSFIIGMIANARYKNEFKIEKSKNTDDGQEYHYEIEIKSWGTTRHSLYFIGIVEGVTIKTGYFNWFDKNRSR